MLLGCPYVGNKKRRRSNLRREKVSEMLSAYRRDSRKPCEDKAAHADNEGRFAYTEVVNHVCDYN
jgi:hypothetical protein